MYSTIRYRKGDVDMYLTKRPVFALNIQPLEAAVR